MNVLKDQMVIGEIYTYEWPKIYGGVYTIASLKESYEPEKLLLVNLTTMHTQLLKLIINEGWIHHPDGTRGHSPIPKPVKKPEPKKIILSSVHKCPRCRSAVEALLCINFTLIKCHQCGYYDGL